MKCGISTNCLMDLPLREVLERLSPLSDTVEIQCDADHSLFTHLEDTQSFDLHYTIHAPTSDGNLACTFEPLRRAAVEVLEDVAKAAGEINAEKIVVHAGYCLEKNLWDESSRAVRRSLAELGKIQKEYSAKFVIENFGGWEICHFRFPDWLPYIRSCGLGFCLDVGHANLNGVLDEFLQAGPDHMHLHDNHGIQDEHAACGSGNIDFAKIMQFPASKTVEVLTFDDVLTSFKYLQNFSV
ncbi:MAG TPA: sugar phosphate isomerase/epimerase [Methanocorpusculum sp.]|nr:sugar phosphate isomerase/epimerase [Methanocorpusculum sp.]